MANRSKSGIFFLTISSFFGGVTLGWLLSPGNGKKNRDWLVKNIDKRGRQVIQKAEERFNHYRNTLKQEMDNSVPNLFKATEHIELDEADLINGF